MRALVLVLVLVLFAFAAAACGEEPPADCYNLGQECRYDAWRSFFGVCVPQTLPGYPGGLQCRYRCIDGSCKAIHDTANPGPGVPYTNAHGECFCYYEYEVPK